jgi:hypothetical protein
MVKWAMLDGPARSTAHLIVLGWARHDNRVVLGSLPWSTVPVRSGTIIYFLFYKTHYIYIFRCYIAIYNKCTRVLLVSLLHITLSPL